MRGVGEGSGKIFWLEAADGLVLAVKAQPSARRVQIGPVVAAVAAPGWPPARLKIAVSAAPEDGRANEAILLALAQWLGVKPGAVVQEAGLAARDKKFRVLGARIGDVWRQFAELPG
jgi:hypothetical protein